MRWESGEGLRGRALPDRGDAKLGMASTCNQITLLKLITIFILNFFGVRNRYISLYF